MIRLKQRELRMLEFLLDQDRFITYKEISDQLDLTERQVRYDLNNVEKYLFKKNLDIIRKNHKRGIMIIEKAELQEQLKFFKQYTTPHEYKYSKKEIQSFILLKLLISDEAVPVSTFENTLFVSRTTVLNNLSEIKTDLLLEELQLIHHKRIGYEVSGSKYKKYLLFTKVLMDLINIRELYSFLIDNEKVFSKEAELVFFNLVDIDQLHQALVECQKIERYIGKVLDDRTFLLLLTVVMKILDGNKTWDINERLTKGGNYSEQESLLFNIIGKVNGGIAAPVGQIKEFLRKILNEVGNLYHVDFAANESFVSQLEAHLQAMAQRVHQSIHVKNPIFHEFVSEYKELFLATKEACSVAESILDIKVGDQEVSFIAIYLASEIRRQENQKVKKARVLIVCVEGLAISQMIMTQIKKIFEYEEVKTMPVREFKVEHLEKYDFVITTIDIPDIQSPKILRINNYLQKKDLEFLGKKLSLKLMANEKKEIDKFNMIMQTIRENTSGITNLSKLELDLINILTKDDMNAPKRNIPKIHFSREYITNDRDVPQNRWDLAVKVGTKGLIEKGHIIQQYEDKIISNLRKFGPYMVIAPGVMIAHAGMEDGVIEDSMWMTILPNGIRLKDRYEKPVKLIFTLAFKSKNTNLLVENIAKLALDDERIKEIVDLRSHSEIYDLVTTTIYN